MDDEGLEVNVVDRGGRERKRQSGQSVSRTMTISEIKLYRKIGLGRHCRRKAVFDEATSQPMCNSFFRVCQADGTGRDGPSRVSPALSS